MSLDYGYIFSQIDKAKKKRKKWTQADTDAAMAKLAEEKEAREPTVSQHRYKDPKDRKPGEKPSTYTKPLEGKGRVTGGKPGGEKTNRGKRKLVGEKRIADVDTEDEGKIHRGTDRKGLPRNFKDEKDKREAAKKKKEQQEKDLKEGVPGWHSTLDPKSHIKYTMVTDAKGNRVKVPVTERVQDRQYNKKPISRKHQLRRESGTFNIKDPVEANRRLAAADRKFEKERDTISTTSLQEFLRDRKKNPPPSGGFVQDTDDPEDVNYDPVSQMADYRKRVKERAAARAKREADKKERESIDPKTKLPKGPKRIEPPRKDRKKKPKVEEYQSEGDPNPEVEGGIDGDDEYSEYEKEAMKEKSLWKAWLKEKMIIPIHSTEYYKQLHEKERKERKEIREMSKAEEGIGGMNMGSQRGLGHDAGYKQDPGESAQITEVKEKTDKCPECKSKLVVPGDYKSSKEKRGHKIRYCDDCGHEWEKKSAYENHEQDESPDSQPNKQQIPPSKPGMDALKMYKKALIIKYNNIYKPANI